MALVKVKEKFQVTLPAEIRKKANLSVGELLEAKVEGKKITLIPKSVVDRDIAISLREFREGKGHGPFKSAKEAIRSLHREAKKLKKKTA
ncbi:MAG: AbrB/MazE/SpoVT family DNA-binding domain-containing protein [Deltaproteobacteria bacterium]|nr:AbrB/MazE/SpoVT family DNA-binding domain-containing protein [Deltaproteobacteria bacterium]